MGWPSNRPTRVLIADDYRLAGQLLREELADDGYDVLAIDRGQALSIAIDHFRPDVLVLEIGLKTIDGLLLLQELHQCYQDLPIVIWSAYEPLMNDPRTRMADICLLKSSNIEPLRQYIHLAADKRQKRLRKPHPRLDEAPT